MNNFENKEILSVNDLLGNLSQNVEFNLQGNQELYTKIEDINSNSEYLLKFTELFNQAAINVGLLNPQEIKTA